MAAYRRNSRTRNVLAVLVLLALTLVTIDARSHGGGALGQIRSKVADAFSPLQRATHAALRPIGNFITGAVDYGSLRAENERLRQELAQAQSQAAVSQAEQQQAEQVLHNYQLDRGVLGAIPMVAVQIIQQGPSNFDNTVTVDKGSADGLSRGQPVLAAGALVGTVVSASAHIATVELVTDPNFQVGVSLAGGNVGSAQGAGRGLPIRVQVFSTNLPVPDNKRGQVVVTSGLSLEKFPKGIPVGKVTNISTSPGAVEPVFYLTPMVDPLSISYLDVALWSPQ
ncbi:MAG: rod shape-determining protein MreC [Acidobacteriota bacterium]|nr:rod shape-determining protein MreC [Acidobacteriota bacterium]